MSGFGLPDRDGLPPAGSGTTRRGVITAGAAVLVLGACTDSSAPGGSPSPPTPDEIAWRRATQDTVELLAQVEAVMASGSPFAGRAAATLSRIAHHHRQHLTALGSSGAPTGATGTQGTATGTQDTATGAGTTTSGPPATPRRLVTTERRAATVALADAAVTSAGLATLLARIAAARAVHADLLARAAGLPMPGAPTRPRAGVTTVAPLAPGGSTKPSTSSAPSRTASTTTPATTSLPLDPQTREAVTHRLEGEHAAVFAYGLVVGRVSRSRRARARRHWAAHVRERDLLETSLRAANVDPPAAAPAYELGAPTSGVAELAERVEHGVAVLAAHAVGVTTGRTRIDAAVALVAAARRAAEWDPAAEALPGDPGPGGSTTPTSSGG